MEIGNSNFTTVYIKFYHFMSYEKCETCKHVFNHKCIFVNDNQIEKIMLKFSLTRSYGATSLTCATMTLHGRSKDIVLYGLSVE